MAILTIHLLKSTLHYYVMCANCAKDMKNGGKCEHCGYTTPKTKGKDKSKDKSKDKKVFPYTAHFFPASY